MFIWDRVIGRGAEDKGTTPYEDAGSSVCDSVDIPVKVTPELN